MRRNQLEHGQQMMRNYFIAALLVFFSPFALPASAQVQPGSFCAQAEKVLQDDAALAALVKQAFGEPGFEKTSSEDCIYPYAALRYRTSQVLLTIKGVPGMGCHACGAKLTAHVLKLEGGSLKVAAAYPDFAEVGANGNPGDAKPITFGGDDGFTLEVGDMHQGWSNTVLYVFVLSNGVTHLTEDDVIPLGVDNSGAVENRRKLHEITSSIKIDPAGTITVRYTGVVERRKINQTAVWTRKGNRLVLTKGKPPAEAIP